MDRDAIARAQRRRQALEAFQFERDRAVVLQEQIEAIVAEMEGRRIDEAAFARMAPEDVEVVRGLLDPPGLEALAELEGLENLEAFSTESDEQSPEAEREEREAEIARLEGEIAASRRRQEAFERYVEALGD